MSDLKNQEINSEKEEIQSHYLESTTHYRKQSDIFKAPEIIQGFNLAADEELYKQTHSKFDFKNSKKTIFERLRYLNFFSFGQLHYRVTEQLIDGKKYFTIGKWFYNPELQYNCPAHSQVSYPESVWTSLVQSILGDGVVQIAKQNQAEVSNLNQDQAEEVFNKEEGHQLIEFSENTTSSTRFRRELRLTQGSEVQVLLSKVYKDREGEWKYTRSQILLPIPAYAALVNKLQADKEGTRIGMWISISEIDSFNFLLFLYLILV